MQPKFLSGLALLIFAGAISNAPAAAQEASTCPANYVGIASFPNLATTRETVLPSVHRQLSGLGRMARKNNCAIKVTCVSASADPAQTVTRDGQCGAARDALAFTASKGKARSAATGAIKIEKLVVPKNRGITPGTVVITLQ